MKKMFLAGANFFDTAEIYGMGECEKAMGRALKELMEELKIERKDFVLSTKLFKCVQGGIGVNDGGMSRKHIIEGMRNSLKRLQQDYADIVFSHRPDYETPLEEQVRAFSWLID
jgi:aryl-alcohol dehydrogenase-like predicted oxidoreductase